MRVVAITARGLQAGMLGCYGNLWVETPALDALAARGAVFAWHFADHADAAGARRAWRSGRYVLPGAEGDVAASLRDAGGSRSDPPTAPDLLAALKQRDVHTRLLVDVTRPPPPDFLEGWDVAEAVAPEEGESTLRAVLTVAAEALDELAGRDGWLLWVDLGPPAPPWDDTPEEFVAPYFAEEEREVGEEEEEEGPEEEPPSRVDDPGTGFLHPDDDVSYLSLQNSYAGAVSWVDAAVGELCEEVRRRAGEDVVLLFTSDHGQNLGEHDLVGPIRPWAHEEVLHLPLLLSLPGTQRPGEHVLALTQSVDLAATLADLFGVELSGAHGHSLLPLARGEVPSVRDYAVSAVEAEGGVEWSLRSPDWAFLLPVRPHPEDAGRAPRLHVKPDDRWEVNDVVQHHLEFADALERTLRAFAAATTRPGPLAAPPLPSPEEDEEEEEEETQDTP